MRSRRPAVDHTEAVARRLAMLSAELDAARADPGGQAAGAVALTRVAGSAVAFETQADGQWQPEPEESVVTPGDEAEYTVPSAPPLAPQTIPSPGRHAMRSHWPETVRAWAPAQVSIVLAGVVLALGITCAWLLLGQESTVVEPLAAPGRAVTSGSDGPTSLPSASPATANTESEVTEVVVHVAGRVRRPGLVVLPAGSRVGDAVEQAGGATKRSQTDGVNLARVLVDGEQIWVGKGAPQPAATAPVPSVPGAATGAPGAAKVSLNSADAQGLETLPGVGPVTAAAIIEWRTRHGGFTAVEELLEVRGIGKVTLEQLLPLVAL